MCASRPHHVYIKEPSKILIRGNPTTSTVGAFDMPVEGIEGSDITVGAYNDESMRIVLMDSTLLNNKYIPQNIKFVKNVINWVSEPG